MLPTYKTMRKISNEFLSERDNHNSFLVIFEDIAKVARIRQVSTHFHPFHPQKQTTGNSFSAVK